MCNAFAQGRRSRCACLRSLRGSALTGSDREVQATLEVPMSKTALVRRLLDEPVRPMGPARALDGVS